jgi:hypothetical protein
MCLKNNHLPLRHNSIGLIGITKLRGSEVGFKEEGEDIVEMKCPGVVSVYEPSIDPVRVILYFWHYQPILG